MSQQIPNGWKEISSYIKRSARTARSAESQLGLQLYRPAFKDRSAVAVFSGELDPLNLAHHD